MNNLGLIDIVVFVSFLYFLFDPIGLGQKVQAVLEPIEMMEYK